MPKVNWKFIKYLFTRKHGWLAQEVLKPNEEILYIISSSRIREKTLGKKDVMPLGIFAATNERVFFYIPKFFGEFEFEEFPYDQITFIKSGRDFRGGYVDFAAGSTKKRIFFIQPRKEAEEITEIIRAHMKTEPAP